MLVCVLAGSLLLRASVTEVTGVVTGEAIPKSCALPYGLTALPVASNQVTGRTDRHK